MKNDRDLQDLYELINHNSEFKNFVTKKFKTSKDFQDFKQQIKSWFETDTNFVFLVKDKSQQVFGVVLLYNLDLLKDAIKVSIFINKNKRNTRAALEVFLLTISFIINKLDIGNIKFNVYKDNQYMLNIIEHRKDFGIQEIGDHSETITFLISRESAINLVQKLKEIF